MSMLENIALTGKIKAALIGDERIDATGINVDTVDTGTVHLRGRVPTDDQARLAEDIAKLNGAPVVVNELTYDREVTVTPEENPAAAGVFGRVTTPEGAPAVEGPSMEHRIMAALEEDDRVNAHLLRVERLEDGLFALRGRQGTVQQRDAAMAVARAVVGGDKIVDDIEIQPAY